MRRTRLGAGAPLRVPGDKSISQRALILASLGTGESRLTGLLHGGDVESTAQALRAMGAQIPELPTDGDEIRIVGVGLKGLGAVDRLDLGNSGTGARLLAGVLASRVGRSTLDGDESLRTRPMERIAKPLHAMGARSQWLEGEGRLPMRIEGKASLDPIEWFSPVASAQVKSSILLAGLTGGAFVLLEEPSKSRDHTERMLAHVGVSVISHPRGQGWRVEMRDPPEQIRPLYMHVPGDVSSAAFLLAFGALGGVPGELTVADVGLNPTRTGFLRVLESMGVQVGVEHSSGSDVPEPYGDVTVRGGELRGVDLTDVDIPSVIDELPLIAVMGAVAHGDTVIRGAEELRTKESDRISVVVENLRSVGAQVEELDDGLVVHGSERPLRGRVHVHHDHRVAMAFGVLGALPQNEIEVDDPDVARVSFPDFRSALRAAGAAV